MLLAAALVLPALERDVFDVDEAASMIAAGASQSGPFSLFEAVELSVSRWPGQGLGHVLSFWLWGRLVGWSEFAIRALPWLIGPLTLAWVYRLGREMSSANVAWAATFLLSTSVVFLSYMHIARSYGAMMLLAAIIIWGYWRIALDRRSPGRGACLALLLGSTGLLYAHYFGALLLLALGIIHILHAGVIGKRRWWMVALLLALAVLFAAPQVWDLYSGIQFNLARESLHGEALRHPDVVSLLIRYLSNGLVVPQQPYNALLVPVLLLLIAPLALRRRIRRQLPGPALFLALAAVLHLILLLASNEWLTVLEPRRVRYLAALWPASMLLISVATQRLLHNFGRIVFLVPLAMIALHGTIDFLQQGELVRHSWAWKEHPVSIPVVRMLAREGAGNDLLLVDVDAFRYENRTYELYTGAWQDRRVQLKPETSVSELTGQTWPYRSVWLLYRNSVRDELHIDDIVDQLRQGGRVEHRVLREGSVSLEQWSAPRNAGGFAETDLEFDRQIRLARAQVLVQADNLELRAVLHSTDVNLLARYSLAVHVIDQRSGELVA